MAYQEGVVNLSNGVTSYTVPFPVAFTPSPPAIVLAVVANYVDDTILQIQATVHAKTANDFTVELDGAPDSDNYVLEWLAGSMSLAFQTLSVIGRKMIDVPVLTSEPGLADRFAMLEMSPVPRTVTIPYGILRSLFARMRTGTPTSEFQPPGSVGDIRIDNEFVHFHNGTQWNKVRFYEDSQSDAVWSGRKVLYVSQGIAATDDRTDISPYDALRPFASLSAAQDAAVAGDVIMVQPGVYGLDESLGKADVNWWFHPGAIVEALSGVTIWAAGDGGYQVLGHGHFSCNNGVAGKVIHIEGPGNFHIEGQFFADAAASIFEVNHTDAEVEIHAIGGGAVGVSTLGAVTNGKVKLKGNFSLSAGSLVGLVLTGSDSYLELAARVSVGDHPVIQIYDGGQLTLRDAVLVRDGVGESITVESGGPTDVLVYSAFANTAIDSDVTALINPVVVNPNVQ